MTITSIHTTKYPNDDDKIKTKNQWGNSNIIENRAINHNDYNTDEKSRQREKEKD